LTSAGPEIYRRIIVLDALRDGSSDFFAELRGGNALPFRGVAQKTAFHQDRRNFDITQDMKTGMLHPAIEHGSARQHHGVNRGGKSDIMLVLRVAGTDANVGTSDMTFIRGV